mmetsp:Transcript_58058/g.80579  ORF Transcript_58058/g.80579 Transcript_58058/m.80579 type:complete len:140 (+) Transcript_58058:2-421(+)
MHIKENAFSLAMFMIPEKYQSAGQIPTLTKMAGLLETAEYQQFWEKAKENNDIISSATGFNSAVREIILDVLGITFKTIDLSFLSEALNLQDPDLKTFLGTKGLKPDGGFVTFPQSDLTQQWHQAVPQNIQFEQLAKVF